MNAGTYIGGPVATPIREMLATMKDGVIFHCKTEKKAENTRYAAIMLKRRNGYDLKTMRKGSDLTVYRKHADPYELHGSMNVYLED